jgi:uncharacterized damage-inducible protein DinB
VRLPEPTANETELLLAYLGALRGAVLHKADGLDEQQARWRPDGKLIALAGIVNHLAHVEWRWIDGAFLGGEASRSEEEFMVPRGRPLADVVAAYQERAERTDEVVRAANPDDLCRGARYRQHSLRWVLLHLIEETARHAGHADATRELLDGSTGD